MAIVEHSPDYAFVDGGPPPETNESLWEQLASIKEKCPNNPAIIVPYQSEKHCAELSGQSWDEGRPPYLEWSHTQLFNAASGLAAALHASGIREDDTLVTFLQNGVEWCIIYLACVRQCITLAPLDPTMVDRPDELESYIKLLQPRGLFAVNAEAAAKIDALGYDRALVKIVLDTNEHVTNQENSNDVSTSSNSTSTWTKFEQFVKPHIGNKAAPVPPNANSLPDKTLSIAFTSGTSSGHPKGCVRTHLAAFTAVQAYIASEKLGPTTRYALINVNFRVILHVVTLGTWLAGGAVVFPVAHFDPIGVMNAMSALKVTHIVLVPALIYALRALKVASESESLSQVTSPSTTGKKPLQITWPSAKETGLEMIISGGDIVRCEHRDLVDRIFGENVAFDSTHGMSEGGGMVTFPPNTNWPHFKSPETDTGILSCGSARPGTLLKIVKSNPAASEAEPRIVAKRGESGDLHLSSTALISSYLEGRNPDDFYRDEKGRQWFITGDVAMIDKDGYVYVLGRTKDVIKYQAISLSPAVLEGALNTRDDVLIKAIGIPHETYGSIPVAVVRLNQSSAANDHGLSTNTDKNTARSELAEALKAQALHKLGPDYTPKAVYFLDDLGFNDFPLNATGKVVSRELISAVAEKGTVFY